MITNILIFVVFLSSYPSYDTITIRRQTADKLRQLADLIDAPEPVDITRARRITVDKKNNRIHIRPVPLPLKK